MGFKDWFRIASKSTSDRETTFNAMGQTFDLANVASSQELAELLRGGMMTSSGESIGISQSLQVAAVYRCINIISGVIGTVPIRIKNEQTMETDWQHEIAVLINRKPNSWQTGHEFRKLLQNSVLMRGNGYAMKVRSGRRVVALIPMAASQVKPEQVADNSIEYSYTSKDGRRVILKQEDVFHVRGMSLDGITGLSVIEYAREAIGFSKAAATHGSSLFKNGTNMGAVLEHPNAVSDDAQKRLREGLEKYRGAKNAGKTLILEEGMTYKPLGMTSQDAEYVENKKFSVMEICMFFGVPPHMIGFTEATTSWGSGIEQQSIGFVNYTLNDWFEAWTGPVERDFLGDRMDLIAEVDASKLLRGDISARSEAAAKSLQWGWKNTNEVRRSEGLPAREGGERFYEPPNTAGQSQEDKTNESS